MAASTLAATGSNAFVEASMNFVNQGLKKRFVKLSCHIVELHIY
jgi:hypothetical protein